ADDVAGVPGPAPTRLAVGVGALVAGPPGVGAPLPDVAMHVVQAPGVGLLAAHRRVVAGGVALEPSAGAPRLPVVAETVVAGRPGPAGILPFRLRRQADHLLVADQLPLAQLDRHLGAEVVGLLPAHHLDGVARALPAAGVLAHHRLVKLLRHLVAG